MNGTETPEPSKKPLFRQLAPWTALLLVAIVAGFVVFNYLNKSSDQQPSNLVTYDNGKNHEAVESASTDNSGYSKIPEMTTKVLNWPRKYATARTARLCLMTSKQRLRHAEMPYLAPFRTSRRMPSMA